MDNIRDYKKKYLKYKNKYFQLHQNKLEGGGAGGRAALAAREEGEEGDNFIFNDFDKQSILDNMKILDDFLLQDLDSSIFRKHKNKLELLNNAMVILINDIRPRTQPISETRENEPSVSETRENEPIVKISANMPFNSTYEESVSDDTLLHIITSLQTPVTDAFVTSFNRSMRAIFNTYTKKPHETNYTCQFNTNFMLHLHINAETPQNTYIDFYYYGFRAIIHRFDYIRKWIFAMEKNDLSSVEINKDYIQRFINTTLRPPLDNKLQARKDAKKKIQTTSINELVQLYQENLSNSKSPELEYIYYLGSVNRTDNEKLGNLVDIVKLFEMDNEGRWNEKRTYFYKLIFKNTEDGDLLQSILYSIGYTKPNSSDEFTEKSKNIVYVVRRITNGDEKILFYDANLK